MKKDLGNIEQVRVRDVWPTEPEFTKWLAQKENLSALGDELGIELTLIKTEASVGGFSADILAETTGGGKSEDKVVIENQFGTTDHDHLGKLLTYSSGRDASYVVWLFENMREEHRQAIDWLNDNTTDELSFFGVKLELWQIGGSLPAPKFHIICQPNEWMKTVRRQTTQDAPSEGKLLQQEFWERFRSFGTEQQTDISFRTPRPQHWYDFSIGSSDAHVSLTMNMKKQLMGCALYIPDNKELFACLEKEREAIERELGAPLEWEPKPKKKACYAIQHLSHFDINNEAQHPEYFAWMLDRITAFKNAFAQRIQDCR